MVSQKALCFAMDITELPDGYNYVADVRNLIQPHVQLESGNVLAIGGTRTTIVESDPRAAYLLREQHSGMCARKFLLPIDSNLNEIRGTWADGILTVTVPKICLPQPAYPRAIEVTIMGGN